MIPIKAYLAGEAISISRVKSVLDSNILHQDRDEIFYQLSDFQFVYIFNYGVVCDCNLDESERSSFLASLSDCIKRPQLTSISEDFVMDIRDEELKVQFDQVIVPRFDTEMIRLAMLNTAQSVALNHYSEISESLMEETNAFTSNLEHSGKLNISGKRLKKFIGRALNIKNKISQNLYIFEAPEIVWVNEEYHVLNQQLKETFELRERYRIITDRVGIIKENLDLFKEYLHHKESSKLEWIIIILILVEVVDMMILKMS